MPLLPKGDVAADLLTEFPMTGYSSVRPAPIGPAPLSDDPEPAAPVVASAHEGEGDVNPYRLRPWTGGDSRLMQFGKVSRPLPLAKTLSPVAPRSVQAFWGWRAGWRVSPADPEYLF